MLQDSLEKLESLMDTHEDSVETVDRLRGEVYEITKEKEVQYMIMLR